jgi:hypothetical protein
MTRLFICWRTRSQNEAQRVRRVGGEAVTRHLATCTGGLHAWGRALREPVGSNPPFCNGPRLVNPFLRRATRRGLVSVRGRRGAAT